MVIILTKMASSFILFSTIQCYYKMWFQQLCPTPWLVFSQDFGARFGEIMRAQTACCRTAISFRMTPFKNNRFYRTNFRCSRTLLQLYGPLAQRDFRLFVLVKFFEFCAHAFCVDFSTGILSGARRRLSTADSGSDVPIRVWTTFLFSEDLGQN